MEKRRIAYGSAVLLIVLAACGGGRTNPIALRAQTAAAAGKVYFASGGTGSGSYSWSNYLGDTCSGTVDYRAGIRLTTSSSGKVDPSSSEVTATGTFEPHCKRWGPAYVTIIYSVDSGVAKESTVSVGADVTNFFCLPGTASGGATLNGSVATAHLFIDKITARCSDEKMSIVLGKVLIHDIHGQLTGGRR